ncbi:Gfo/Idh/MocA family protein [Shouchella sp. JSM 1781072]|uniref:Gfo/Idh/MocA family protein n=1 Tax=Shouchella sp. JSM 1781072 TaxID=3344581 RepID=UPI0035BF6AB9
MMRVAVLGLNHGYKFASQMVQSDRVKLVAVAGNDEQSIQRSNELGVPIYSDYKQLLQTNQLDGAIITLPNQLHLEAVDACAKLGIHVLVEKPIAPTIEEGRAMIDLCKSHHVHLLVGHHRRLAKNVLEMRRLIRDGAIGELVAVTMTCALCKDKAYFNESWRVEKGGGPLLINSIHDIDTLRFVTGKEVTNVYAASRNRIRGNQVEDSASILLELEDGATVTYFITDGIPAPWAYDLNLNENDRFYHHEADCYAFFGTEGSISFPSMEHYSYSEDAYGWAHPLQKQTHSVKKNDPFFAEWNHFLDVIENDVQPIITGEDALATLEVLLTIQQSAALKQTIALKNKTYVQE